jgi:hypothetical protein
MKVIVALCMQWSSVFASQTITQKCAEAVAGNCGAKMLTLIGTREFAYVGKTANATRSRL